MKIIVIFRNPIDRAYSGYQMGIEKGWVSLPFEKALEKEWRLIHSHQDLFEQDPTTFWKKYRRYSYLHRGIYIHQLERSFAHFSREQFLILSYLEFIAKPGETMEQVFSFFGLEEFRGKYPIRHSKYTGIAPEARNRLAEFFRPYNGELEELLGQKFNWD